MQGVIIKCTRHECSVCEPKATPAPYRIFKCTGLMLSDMGNPYIRTPTTIGVIWQQCFATQAMETSRQHSRLHKLKNHWERGR